MLRRAFVFMAAAAFLSAAPGICVSAADGGGAGTLPQGVCEEMLSDVREGNLPGKGRAKGDPVRYIDGQVLLFVSDETETDGVRDSRAAREAAEFLGGEVAGMSQYMPVYQVRVPGGTYGELDEACSDVMGAGIEGLSGAMVDIAVRLSDPEDGQDGADSVSPVASGPEWWESVYRNGARAKMGGKPGVKIGIIEQAFHLDDPGLDITYSQASAEHVEKYLAGGRSRGDWHGSLVAALAGARHDSYVDGMAPAGTPVHCVCPYSNDGEDLSFSFAIMESVAECLEEGCGVINVSQGIPMDGTDADSVELSLSEIRLSRVYAMAYMAYFRDVMGKDFVVVQAAGNDGCGTESRVGLFTCPVYKDMVSGIQDGMHRTNDNGRGDSWGWESQSHLESLFMDIRDRIVVVGAAQWENGSYGRWQDAGRSEDGSFYFEGSNHGWDVDIMAPGHGIVVPDGWEGISTESPFSGTSFAAPMVSGALSMVMGKYGCSGAAAKAFVLGSALEEVPGNSEFTETMTYTPTFLLDAGMAMLYAEQQYQLDDVVDLEQEYLPGIPSVTQQNLSLRIGLLERDLHFSQIGGTYCFSNKFAYDEPRRDEKETIHWSGEGYGWFYAPIRDRDGNLFLKLRKLDAQAASLGTDVLKGVLCLEKHMTFGMDRIDVDGNIDHYYTRSPYGLEGLRMFQVFPEGADVPDVGVDIPDGYVGADGKLLRQMLFSRHGGRKGDTYEIGYFSWY